MAKIRNHANDGMFLEMSCNEVILGMHGIFLELAPSPKCNSVLAKSGWARTYNVKRSTCRKEGILDLAILAGAITMGREATWLFGCKWFWIHELC